MKSTVRVSQNAGCVLVRPAANDLVNARGRFQVEHLRGGKQIGKYDIHNSITDEGKDKLLDVMFHGVAAIGAWFVLLVDGAGTPVLADADTYAHINGTNGWDEFTAYTEATRPAWTEGVSSGQSITNASPVVFNISSSGNVEGLAIVGGGTDPAVKNNAAGGGTLWAAAVFTSGTVAVLNGDQLKVTYTVNA